MCYDISFKTDIETLGEYIPTLLTESATGFQDREHIMAQAFSKYPVIVADEDAYKVQMFEWGVIAGYMNTPEKIRKSRSFMCNAQSEKIVHDKKSYWHRIRKNRCLIPVTGIFEHRDIQGWKHKVPYFVHLHDREIFCIPGLFNYAPDPETGEAKGTYTLITRAANNIMEKIHNGGLHAGRMPLFLKDREMELRWLDRKLNDKGIDDILDYEIPSTHLDYRPVYTIRSTKPRPDQKDKTEMYEWQNLPVLGTE